MSQKLWPMLISMSDCGLNLESWLSFCPKRCQQILKNVFPAYPTDWGEYLWDDSRWPAIACYFNLDRLFGVKPHRATYSTRSYYLRVWKYSSWAIPSKLPIVYEKKDLRVEVTEGSYDWWLELLPRCGQHHQQARKYHTPITYFKIVKLTMKSFQPRKIPR